MSLNIKDGNGSSTTLKTTIDTGDHVPHHIIDGTITVSSSITNPLAVTGTILAVTPIATTVNKACINSFSWNTAASGTFNLVSESASRKGLTIFNPGPSNLYISLSTVGDTKNGFILTDTASAPAVYTTILYASGTYIADNTTLNVYHGGYFISGSASDAVFVTSIA